MALIFALEKVSASESENYSHFIVSRLLVAVVFIYYIQHNHCLCTLSLMWKSLQVIYCMLMRVSEFKIIFGVREKFRRSSSRKINHCVGQ